MSLVRVCLDVFDLLSHKDIPAGEGNKLITKIGINYFDVPAGGIVLPLLQQRFNVGILRLRRLAAREKDWSDRTICKAFFLELNDPG